MVEFRCFKRTLTVLTFAVLLQCIYVSNAQSSNGVYTLSTQDVTESTLESTDGSSTITTTLPPTTTAEIMIAADSSRCPVIVLSPGYIATHIGTAATFKAVIESYFDEALESRWSSLNQSIDINHLKFLGSKNIPFPELVINNVTFEDDGIYEIQVRINDGWCIGNTVQLETIGVLDFDNPCNNSKECDTQKNLVCSSVSQSCICNNAYYSNNGTCYLRTGLRAVFSSSKIATSNITVWWNPPNHDVNLVQSYNVSLRAFDSSYIFQTSVGLQTNYTFESYFPPGHLYFLEITSVVYLSDSAETIFVKTTTFNLVVDPLPPGPIDSNTSNFHPQKLFLRWPQDTYKELKYEIQINGYWKTAYSAEIHWPDLYLEPDSSYPVRIMVICWYRQSYRKRSSYFGGIQTLRVPKVSFQNLEFKAKISSKYELEVRIQNMTDYPLTTAVKWQRYNEDINITDTRYIGSTEDFFAPKLVINGVDFVNDHQVYYHCVATNSEGSWTASARINVYDSFGFLESCNRSEQCDREKYLVCRQNTCLCQYYYYHYNFTCFHSSYVRGSLIVETDVCKATLRWNHVNIDHRVKTNYIIKRRSLRNNRWVYDETMLEGNATQYTFSQCILQPGRLYNFYIRSNVLLTNPNETFYVDSSSWDVIMEPLSPGKIDRRRSIFSPNQLMLRWERSGQNTFLNHYRVEIDGHQQQTFGSIPKIYWTKQLTPGTRYNVTITAVSYGSLSRWHWYGTKESEPFEDWIETDTGDREGYSYLSFGQSDELLRGDDKTSATLKSPITIYAGDGLEGGFTFVRPNSTSNAQLTEEQLEQQNYADKK